MLYNGDSKVLLSPGRGLHLAWNPNIAMFISSLCGGEEVTIALREVGDHMKKVEESLLSYPGLHDVVEAVELVVAGLRAIREDISTSSSTTTTYIHPSNFNSFKSMLLGGVACLDSILETTPTSMCARGRTRQLQLLSFLATLLVDLLSSNEGEVELPRDHTFPHDHTSPGQSHEDDEEEDCYKASLVTSCLPILLTSRDIINKVLVFAAPLTCLSPSLPPSQAAPLTCLPWLLGASSVYNMVMMVMVCLI